MARHLDEYAASPKQVIKFNVRLHVYVHTHPSGKRMEVHHQALWRSTFKIRQQFGLKAQLGGWHNMSADALVREITAFHRMRRHDEVVNAIILAALDATPSG